MKMTPIYNNVLRMLGSIQVGTYIDGTHLVRVMEDAPLVPHVGPYTVADMTVNFCEITKQEMLFRAPRGEVTYHYLVIDHKLPDWFWKNKGCVELNLDHLKRVRW